jgi:hypothetical protein
MRWGVVREGLAKQEWGRTVQARRQVSEPLVPVRLQILITHNA